MNARNPKVDAFLGRAKKWQPELARLREIILACDLTEELKWGQPCYTHEGANVVLIGAFKEYVSTLFMKGALLADPKGLLVQLGQTQAGRVMKFSSLEQIGKTEATLKRYVREAIAAEKAGLKVKLNKEVRLPEELERRLAQEPALAAAFRALTPGRQRAYGYYISSAKQPKTREARIDKHVPRILQGKGLDD